MIWQTSPGIPPDLQPGGCAVMTCWWWTALIGRIPVSTELIAWHWRNVLLPSGAVDVDGEIQDWKETYRLMGVDVIYMQSRAPAVYSCGPGEWEHLCWTRPDGKLHFTCGNGHGAVTYDPMGESQTVALGWVRDKRIFRLRG